MARYIDENDVYKLVEPSGVSRVYYSQIDELPRADVVPRSEVEKIFEEIEERIAIHAFTSKSEDYADGMYDAVAWVDSKIAELKKKYTEENAKYAKW